MLISKYDVHIPRVGQLCSYDGPGGTGVDTSGGDNTDTAGGGGFVDNGSWDLSSDPSVIGSNSPMSYSHDVSATPVDVISAIGATAVAGYTAATGNTGLTAAAIAAGAPGLANVGRDLGTGISNLGAGFSANPSQSMFDTSPVGYDVTSGNPNSYGGGTVSPYDQQTQAVYGGNDTFGAGSG